MFRVEQFDGLPTSHNNVPRGTIFSCVQRFSFLCNPAPFVILSAAEADATASEGSLPIETLSRRLGEFPRGFPWAMRSDHTEN